MPVRLSDVSEGIRLSDIPDEPKKAVRLSDVPEVKKKPKISVGKLIFQPISKTLTGKSIGERTDLLRKRGEALTQQAIKEGRAPSVSEFFIKQLPAATAQTAVEFADISPFDAGIIAATMGVGRIPIKGATVGQIAKRVSVGRGFFGRAKELGRLQTTLRKAAITSARTPLIKQPSVIQRTSDVIRESVGKVKDKGKLFRDTAEVQLVDRFAPIRNFVAMTEEVIGKPVNFADNPHIGARLYAGVGGKIKQRLNLLGDIIRPERKNIRFLNEIMKNERFIERANRGFLNPGNATAKSAQDSLNNLKARIGNATFDRLKNTANRVRRELTDKLLIESRDAGVISQEAFKTIQAKNQFYSPFDVLEFMADNLGRFPGGKRSFSVATQDIIKPIKGTIKDIDEPLTAIVRKIFKVVNINERNKVAQKMVNLRNLSPNMKEFVIPLKEGQIIPRGMDRFSALFDGTKKSFAIPSEVAESLKGLNAENMDLLTNLASIGTRALRTGATQLNLAFALPNVLRDFQTAKLVSKTGFNVRNWVRGLASVLKKDQMFNLYEESGASFSGFFQRGRRLPASIQEIVGPSISKKIIKNLNPFKVIAKVAETSELTTRVGVFKRALKSGLSRTQAAFEARESTIDFAKMGTKMKIINQWVPFLNARLQGSLNVARVSLTPKSPRFNPARAAWLASSMVTLPQVTTYMWNTTNYPDVWDDLRDFEKDRNFIFIYGKDKDEEGRWLNIVKIPKGDFGRLVGNPVQDFLEFWRGTKPVDFGQTALKTISDFSPIEFEREGKLSAGVALSSGLPPAAKAAIEARTGVSLYTGFPTVSRNLQGVSPREQFTEKTPKALVQLGRTFNISPIKLDRSLRTVFGGLGSQIPAVVSGVGGATGLIPGGEFGRGLGLAQRFVGAKGGQLLEQDFELVSEISKDIKDVKIRNQREALKILERSKQIPIGEERKQFLREEFQDKPKLFKVFVDLLVKGEDEAIFRFIKSLPIEGRIRYVKERITTMDTEEERIQFFNLMRDKEIISKGFIKELFK